MSVTDHRRLGIAAGAAFLTLAVTGCSGLGRDAVGTVAYETGRHRPITVFNPLVRGCHRLPPGAIQVANRTLVDLVLYPTPDCTGRGTTYLGSTLSDVTAPGAPPWRSYTIVH